ncbi:MAG: lysophospholipid acyltransferase family protein [Alphaproteobacteria bacterium]
MRSFKAALKFALYLLCVLIMVPMQYAIFFVHGSDKHAPFLPLIFHKLTRRIFGIRLEIISAPVKNRPALFVCNHISYLDIPVLGSIIQASFVAKKEVDSWPLFNILARLQQTAFIERKTTAIKREAGAIEEKLRHGRSFIIFPEGTSSDGRQVWPFKSSLFSLAVGTGKNLLIQPLTISLLSVDGKRPVDQAVRETYAWHLHMDISLGPHFWNFARGSGAVLRITFHELLESSAFSDRKELARACHALVNKGLVVPT